MIVRTGRRSNFFQYARAQTIARTSIAEGHFVSGGDHQPAQSLGNAANFPGFVLNAAFVAFIHCAPMAKALTKSQIAATIAEQVGVTKKQAVQVLNLVADMAYKQAKNTFTLPGIGKLVLVNRPARTMTMQFGPKKGQTIKVPARRVVKFRRNWVWLI
jgi:DNA-binding protein HU-beta